MKAAWGISIGGEAKVIMTKRDISNLHVWLSQYLLEVQESENRIKLEIQSMKPNWDKFLIGEAEEKRLKKGVCTFGGDV